MLPRIWNRWFNRLLKKSSTINKTEVKTPILEKLEDKLAPATISYNPVWSESTTGGVYTITDSATTPAIVWNQAPFTTIRGYTPQDLNINLSAGEQITVSTEIDYNVRLTGERDVDKISNPTGQWNFGSFEYAPTGVEGHAASKFASSTSNDNYLGDFNGDGTYEWMYGPSTISNVTFGNPVPAYGYANTKGMQMNKWNTGGATKGISSQYYAYNTNVAPEQNPLARTLPYALGSVVPTTLGLGADGTVAAFGDYLTLRITVASNQPLAGGGVISNGNASPSDNPSVNPFSWSFSGQGTDGLYRATGLLRSKNLYMGSPGSTGTVTMGVGDSSFTYNYATQPQLGYLYTNNINITGSSGAEQIDLNGLTLFTDRTVRINRNLTGTPTDYTMIGLYGTLNVNTNDPATGARQAGDTINVKGPIETFGQRGLDLGFTTDHFSNNFGGGSKIETNGPYGGSFNLDATTVDIGTDYERIYANSFNFRANNFSFNRDENTAFNMTTNEMLACIGQQAGLIAPSFNIYGGGNFDVGGNANNVTDLSLSNIKSYNIHNYQNVQFYSMLKLPTGSALKFELGSSAGTIYSSNTTPETNPNGIDILIEGGTLKLGTIDSYGKTDAVGVVGKSTRSLRTSINTLESVEVLGDFYLENYSNPQVGGQNADLIVGAASKTGPIFQASAGSMFFLSTTNGKATINAQVTANKNLVLKTASYTLGTKGSLASTNSIQLEPSITDYDVMIGNQTAQTGNIFNVTYSDVTNRLTTQNLIIGALGLAGNFSIFNNTNPGTTTTNPLSLMTQNFNFTVLGKDSDVTLNAGILLADNRRMSFQNGVGGLGKITSNIALTSATPGTFYDVSFGTGGTGTKGVIDFAASGQIGDTNRPIITKASRIDASNAPLGMYVQNQSGIIILDQLNTGTSPLQFYATGLISRSNKSAQADLVGGPIEVWTNGNSLGTLDDPLRISGDSIAARSLGDTALFLSNPTGTDGDVIDVATATSMRIFTYGSGLSATPIPTGIWSAPVDDSTNKRIQGTNLLSGLQGAKNTSVYRLNADNQISITLPNGNPAPDPYLASVNLVYANLDIQRFAQQVRYLNGNGGLVSDPLIGQSKSLTVKTTQSWDAPIFTGTINGSLDIIKTDANPDNGQSLAQTGSFTLTGDNKKLVGDVRILSGSVVLASSTAAGSNNTIRIGNGSLNPDQTSLSLSNNITVTNKVQINSDNIFITNVDGKNTLSPGTGIELPRATTDLVIDVPSSPDATKSWSLSIGASITGPGFVDKTGNGLLILTKTNTFAGNLHIYGGTLEVQASNTLGKGKAIFEPGTIFQIVSPTGSALNFDVDGGIDFLGQNTLNALSSANIRITNNSIRLLGGSPVSKDNFKIYVDATRWLKIESLTNINALDGTNTNIVRDERLNAAGVATGTGVLEMKGPSVYKNLTANLGTVIFDNQNSIGTGSINVGRVGTLNTFGTVAFDPGSGNSMTVSNLVYLLGKGSADNPAPLVNDQSVLKVLSGDVTIVGAITLTSTANVPTLPIFVEGGSNLFVPSSINDGGANLALEKKGTGDLFLSAPNVYGGGTQVLAGTIHVLDSNSIYTGPVRISDLAAVVVALGFDSLGNPLVGNFVNQIGMEGSGPNGAGALVVESGTVGFTPTTPFVLYKSTTIGIPDPNSSLKLTGNITEGSVSSGITKTGTGLLTLVPTTFSSITGPNLVSSGPVEIQGDNAFGRGDTTIADGAGLRINPTTAALSAGLFNNFIVGGNGFIAPPNTKAISTKGVIELVPGTKSTITGNLTLTSSITIDVETGSVLTIDGVIDENATGVAYNITKTGDGILRLTGSTANLLDGDIIVLGGAVDFGKTGAAGTGLIQVQDGGSIYVSGGNTPGAATVITNAIEVEGKGLNNQGAIKVTQGYVNLSGDITITDKNGDNSSLLWLGANTTGNLTIANPFTLATVATSLDLVSGGNGAGIVNLNGSNIYTGQTTVQKGALVANADNAIGLNQLVDVQDGGTLGVSGLASSLAQKQINLVGSGLNLAGTNVGALWMTDTAGDVTLPQNITLDDTINPVSIGVNDAASQMNLTGVISSLATAGKTSVVKVGQGTLDLTNTNSFGGGTTVQTGTLKLENNGALGNSSGTLAIQPGATLALDIALASFANPFSIAGNGVNGAGAIDVLSGAATFTSPGSLVAPQVTINSEAGAALTFAQTLTETALTNLVKTGSGYVSLQKDNKLTGPVQVKAGLLELGSNLAAGTGAISVNDGATLGIESPVTAIANKLTLVGQGQAQAKTGPTTPDAALWVESKTSVAFNGVVELGVTNSVINNLASTAINVDANSKATFNGKVKETAANGSVASQLVKRGQGQAEVLGSAANDIDFRGGINVESGKLTLGVNNTSTNFKNGGSLNVNYGATLLLQGNSSINNAVNLGVPGKTGSAPGFGTAGTSNITITKDITVDNNSIRIETADTSSLTLQGAIVKGSGQTILSMIKDGTGTLALNNQKSSSQVDNGLTVKAGILNLNAKAPYVPFAGDLTIQGGAQVNLLAANQIPTIANVTINSGGILNLNGNSTPVNSVAMSGNTSQIQGTGSKLTANLDFTLNGGTVEANLAGSVGLTKDVNSLVDSGILTLKGQNFYTGSTDVKAGRLILINAAGNALPDSATVNLSGATSSLDIEASEVLGSVVSILPTTQLIIGTAKTLTLTSAADTVFPSQISSTGGILKSTGTRLLTLTGDNSAFSGGEIRIESGSAEFVGGKSLGNQTTPPKLTALAGTVATISAPGTNTFNNDIDLGSTLVSKAGTATFGGNITLTSISAKITVNGTAVIVTKAIANSSPTATSFTKDGNGSLTIANAMDLKGGTITVPTGVLVAGNDNSLGNGTSTVSVSTGASIAFDTNLNGANLALNNPITLGGNGFGGQGALTVAAGSRTVTLSGNLSLTSNTIVRVDAGSTLVINGTVSGTFKITKVGLGTLIFNGGQSNSVDIQGGVVVYSASMAGKPINIGSQGTLQIPAGFTVANSITTAGTIQATGVGISAVSGPITTSGTPTFLADSGSTLNLDSTLGGTATAISTGGVGIVNVNATNSLVGPWTVQNGTLGINNTGAFNGNNILIQNGGIVLGANANLGALDTTNDTVVVDLNGFNGTLNVIGGHSFAGIISGPSSSILTINGNGSQTFTGTGSNTLVGDVIANSGNTILNKTGNAVAIVGALVVNPTATVTLAASGQMDSGSLATVAGGTLSTGNTSQSFDSLSVQSGSITGTGTLNLVTDINLESGTVTAALVGSSGLTKINSGTVTLSGPVTTSNPVLILGGKLVLGQPDILLGTPGVNLFAGTTLSLQADQTILGLSGPGTVQLNGNKFTILANSPVTFSGSITGNGTLAKAGTANLTLTGSNSPQFTTIQAGQILLANPARNSTTLAGSISVTPGTSLVLGLANQIADTASIAINNGTFAMNNFSETVKDVTLTGSNGFITNSLVSILTINGNFYLETNPTNIQVTIAGPGVFVYRVSTTITAPVPTTGGVVVDGPGVVVTLAGSTQVINGNLKIINGGTVALANNNQISDNGIVRIEGNSTFDIASFKDTVAGVELIFGSLLGTTGILTSKASVISENGTITGILAGVDSTVGLVKQNATGTVTVSTPQLLTGELRVTAGILVANSASTATFSMSKVLVNGGTLSVGSNATVAQFANTPDLTVSAGLLSLGNFTQTFKTIALTGGEITSTGGSLLTQQANYLLANGIVSANLGGAFTGLIASGTGTLVLSGNNTYGGLTLVSGGTVAANSNGISIPGNVNITGGTLLLLKENQIADTATVNITGGALNFGSSQISETVSLLIVDGGLVGPVAGGSLGTLTASSYDFRAGRVNSTLAGSGRIVKTTSGTFTLSATNIHTGGNDIQAGTVNLGATNGGSLPGATLVRTATVTLQANNQITGTLEIQGGTINIGGFNNTVQSLNLVSGSINGNAGTLTSLSDIQTSQGTIGAVLGGGVNFIKNSSGTLTITKPSVYSGNTTINGGVVALSGSGSLPDSSVVTVASGATLNLAGISDKIGGLNGAGVVNLGLIPTTNLNVGVISPSSVNSFAGNISGTGNLLKSGPGNQTLTGNNTFAGNVQVAEGTLALSGAGKDTIGNTNPVSIGSPGTLSVLSSEVTGPVTGAGVINIASGSTLTSAYPSTSAITSTWVGAGTFLKTGSGSVSINTSSPSFGGTIAVSQGILSFAGTSGGTLATQGGTLNAIGSASTISGQSGTFSPGSSPGQMNSQILNLESGATYLAEIAGLTPGTGYDQTIVTTGVNLGNSKLNTQLLGGYKPSAGQQFTIVDNQSSTAVVGTFAGLPEGSSFVSGSTRFQITYKGGTGNDVLLTVAQANVSGGMVLGSPGETAPGAVSVVTIYNTNGVATRSFAPFPNYGGSLRTAVGDLNGDGTADIIVATGAGAVPAVKAFDGKTNALITSFLAYAQNYFGGVSIAAGDVNGDGFADIVTGTLTMSNHIKVFSGKDNTTLKSFMPYGSGYNGGVNIAAGDYTGDGKAEVIIGAAKNSSHTLVLDVSSPTLGGYTIVDSFFAFANQNLAGGVFVAAADINGDGKADILAGTGSGAPQMKVYYGPNRTPGVTVNLNPNFAGGVRVTIGDLDGDGLIDIVGGSGPGYVPTISVYAGLTGAYLKNIPSPYPNTFRGGIVF